MEATKRGPEWGNNGGRQRPRTDDPKTTAASARSSWIKAFLGRPESSHREHPAPPPTSALDTTGGRQNAAIVNKVGGPWSDPMLSLTSRANICRESLKGSGANNCL